MALVLGLNKALHGTEKIIGLVDCFQCQVVWLDTIVRGAKG